MTILLDAFNAGGGTWIPPNPLVMGSIKPVLDATPAPVRLRISCEDILVTAQNLGEVQTWLAGHVLNGVTAAVRIVTLETTPPYLGPDPKGPPADQTGWELLVQTIYQHWAALGPTWIEWRNEPDNMDGYTVQQLLDWWSITFAAVRGVDPTAVLGGLALSNEFATGTPIDPRPGGNFLMRSWLVHTQQTNTKPGFLSHHSFGSSGVWQAENIPPTFQQWMLDAGYPQADADAMFITMDEWNREVGDPDNIMAPGLARAGRIMLALQGRWQTHQTLVDTGPTDYRSGWFSRYGPAHPKWQVLRLAWRLLGGSWVADTAPYADEIASILVTWHAAEDLYRFLIISENAGTTTIPIIAPPGATSATVLRAHAPTLPTYAKVLQDEQKAALRLSNPTKFLEFVAQVNARRNADVDDSEIAAPIVGDVIAVTLEGPGAAVLTVKQ